MKASTLFTVTSIAVAAMLAMLMTPGFVTGQIVTAPGQNKLLCFDGPSDGTIYGGKCTLLANGAKGPASLDNTDTDPDGDYAGVYVQNTTLTGMPLTAVKQLSYTYSGTTTPTPGNLSLNLPLDTDGDGISDAYAFIDAFYCAGTQGKVDAINDAVCGIWVNGIEYDNWAALVAAHPTWTIGPDGFLPFVIAERTPSEGPALWRVVNVSLGKPGK